MTVIIIIFVIIIITKNKKQMLGDFRITIITTLDKRLNLIQAYTFNKAPIITTINYTNYY